MRVAGRIPSASLVKYANSRPERAFRIVPWLVARSPGTYAMQLQACASRLNVSRMMSVTRASFVDWTVFATSIVRHVSEVLIVLETGFVRPQIHATSTTSAPTTLNALGLAPCATNLGSASTPTNFR